MDENAITITTFNLNKVCRVCLLEHEGMHSLFSELENEDNVKEESTFVFELLQNVSTMKILPNDGLPSKLCDKCLELAHTSFKFQQKCNQTQAWLDDYVSRLESVKNEENATEAFNSQLIVDDKTLPVVIHYLDGNSLSSDQMKHVLLNDETCEALQESNAADNLDDPDVSDCSQPFVSVKQFAFINQTHMMDNDSDDLEDVANLEDAVLKDEMFNQESHVTLGDNEKVDSDSYFELDDLNEQNDAEHKPDKTKKKRFSYYLKQTESGEKVYACNLCSKTYKFHSSLQVHMKSHTLERPYVCNVCGKNFKQYGSLSHHLRIHTGERPYTCKLCGKQYKQSGTLTAHMRVHTGQKPFLCSVCGRGFRQAPDLNYHMRTHTKEKPYMCNICGKTMTMQCHLVQHMRTHTGERPFQCTQCNKAFPSSTRLKRHAIIHTGLKPYKCEVCHKAFNRSSSLRVHGKIHTDERPYICHICGKGFIQAHSLRGHIHTIHTSSTSPNRPISLDS